MPEEQPARDAWHLDRKVPIALIFVLAGQAATGVWIAGRLQSQVEHHDRRIVALEATDARMGEDARRISEYLARMDERLQAQTAILRRVEDALRPSLPPR
jgi:hypothetical protein